MKYNIKDACWNWLNGYCIEEMEYCLERNVSEVRNEDLFGTVCQDGYKCCVISKEDETVSRADTYCGNNTMTIDLNTGQNKWPWMATLQYYGKTWCGGTVINESWILTSANCFYEYAYDPIEAWTVSVGSSLVDLYNPYIISIPIESFSMHPGYSSQPRSSNLAMVKLKEPLIFNQTIQSACLPEFNETFEESVCLQLGFGPSTDYGINYVLHQISLPIMNLSECAFHNCKYGNTVYNTSICLGTESTQGTTCGCDKGGPIICRKKNGFSSDLQWILAGVLDSLDVCMIDGVPRIHTSVQPHLDWIDKVMKIGYNYLTEHDVKLPDIYKCENYLKK